MQTFKDFLVEMDAKSTVFASIFGVLALYATSKATIYFLKIWWQGVVYRWQFKDTEINAKIIAEVPKIIKQLESMDSWKILVSDDEFEDLLFTYINKNTDRYEQNGKKIIFEYMVREVGKKDAKDIIYLLSKAENKLEAFKHESKQQGWF